MSVKTSRFMSLQFAMTMADWEDSDIKTVDEVLEAADKIHDFLQKSGSDMAMDTLGNVHSLFPTGGEYN